jgi:hypothetical protein
MIKYLLKITAKKKYAEDLIAGKLYMNCAEYYQHMQNGIKGQADPMEAAVSSTSMMFINPLCPIYCMYQVEDSEVKLGKISVSKCAIEEFCAANGYIVLIPYDSFVERLNTCDTNGHGLYYGSVRYGSIDLSLTKKLFHESGIKQLFIKGKNFSIQKEYRIVVCEQLSHKLVNEEIDGKSVPVEKGFDHKIYEIPQGFTDVMQLYNVSQLECDDEYYYLPEKV